MKFIINDIPPSNNKYLGRSAKGFYHTYQREKELWAEKVMVSVLQNRKNKPKKPLKKAEVTLVYYFKTRHRRDPDNYSGKFLLDGLVNEGIIKDDSFSSIELKLVGKYDKDNPRTEMIIKEMEK